MSPSSKDPVNVIPTPSSINDSKLETLCYRSMLSGTLTMTTHVYMCHESHIVCIHNLVQNSLSSPRLPSLSYNTLSPNPISPPSATPHPIPLLRLLIGPLPNDPISLPSRPRMRLAPFFPYPRFTPTRGLAVQDELVVRDLG
jgi:hypothetical protein